MAKNNNNETMEQREQTGTRSRSAESRQRKTEGQLPDIPETMEDYMLRQLKKTVILKDGNTLKDPHDGHELTAEEAIAHNMINAAMKGDVKAATYIQNLQARAKIMKKK